MMQKLFLLSQLLGAIYSENQFSKGTINKHQYKETYQLKLIPDDGSYLLSIKDIACAIYFIFFDLMPDNIF